MRVFTLALLFALPQCPLPQPSPRPPSGTTTLPAPIPSPLPSPTLPSVEIRFKLVPKEHECKPKSIAFVADPLPLGCAVEIDAEVYVEGKIQPRTLVKGDLAWSFGGSVSAKDDENPYRRWLESKAVGAYEVKVQMPMPGGEIIVGKFAGSVK